MSPSPYAPPAATVSDPAQARGPVPASLRRAAQLLWVSIALTVVLMTLYFTGVVKSVNLSAELATTFITVLLMVPIALMVRAGIGWVRWAFAVMFAFGTVMFALLVIITPAVFTSLSVVQQISALIQFAVQTWAVVLMFVRTSREWFAAR